MTPHPLLRPGVTAPAFDADLSRTWLAAVHQLARETGGRVVAALQHPRTGRNYYQVRALSAQGDPVRYLLNAAARVVAVADDTDPGGLVPRFIDRPAGDPLHPAGLHLATRAELEQPLTPADTTALTAAEQRDIAYHHPERLGDLLFNWFD